MTDDDRVRCVDGCAYLQPPACLKWRQAGLLTAIVGRDLAHLPQRCPAFVARNAAARRKLTPPNERTDHDER